uniref:Odorant receptor n=1 Tax=Protaetia brevitarsis TaxID=348688 RepID=A0A411HR26_PROBE|nr:odorant receptor [Protaetia brevitarsis]
MAIIGRPVLKLPLFIMSLYGLNLFNPSKNYRKFLIIWLAQTVIASTTLVVLKDFQELDADVWITFMAASQGTIKSVVLLIKKETFVEVKELLNNLRLQRGNVEDTDSMRNFECFAIRCQNTYSFLQLLSLLAFMGKPFVMDGRILPSEGYTPCDIRGDACYIFSYILQCYAGIYSILVIVSADDLFWGLLSCGYIDMEYVKHILLHLKVEERVEGDDSKVLQQIAFVVEQHNQILMYLKKINRAYAGLLVYQCFITFFIVGMSQFCLTASGFPPPLHIVSTYAPYFLASLFQIFLYCMAGDIVARQSETIGEAAYGSKWWLKHQPKLRRALCLIIMRSQRTLKFTMVVWVLNLETFCAILKTTMSFLAVMKTFYE